MHDTKTFLATYKGPKQRCKESVSEARCHEDQSTKSRRQTKLKLNPLKEHEKSR